MLEDNADDAVVLQPQGYDGSGVGDPTGLKG